MAPRLTAYILQNDFPEAEKKKKEAYLMDHITNSKDVKEKEVCVTAMSRIVVS